jgi:LacI family transcriptional regulator
MGEKGERKKRPTQADVAELANVSQTTVSHVLNNNQTIAVPEETRRRVLAAIDELQYVPDRMARSLRTRKTLTLAGIIPDITNPFYPAFARGIQDVAEQHGYDLILYNTDGIIDKERKVLRSIQQGRVDGVIVVLFHANARDLFPILDAGIAVVRLETQPKQPGIYPLDNIYVDNQRAAQEAVSYLIGCGHRRIGLIAGELAAPPRASRLQGYCSDETLIQSGDFRQEGGFTGMQALLALPEPPTAVFVANDLMAIAALNAARLAGLDVPKDIAVIGFDDIPVARLSNPALTTIAQFPERLGRRAAEMLIERLTETLPEGGRCEEMPFTLVVRESA